MGLVEVADRNDPRDNIQCNSPVQQIDKEISIAIPTYGRDEVLVATVAELLAQTDAGAELLILDQTPQHDEQADRKLRQWNENGAIRWIRQSPPSITAAMNRGLSEARSPIVLFLDDDIVPSKHLLEEHITAHDGHPECWAVVGQVLQPGEEPSDSAGGFARTGLRADLGFPFHSQQAQRVHNVMAGNLSVRRDRALQIGGFDENFVRVAYRFETDFARRLLAAGGRIWFAPAASIRHLRAARGGTRTFTDHRRSHRPDHAVGDYYFALRHARGMERWSYCAHRAIRSVCTKYHLRQPWWIVPKLTGELRGLIWAASLVGNSPKLLTNISGGEHFQESACPTVAG